VIHREYVSLEQLKALRTYVVGEDACFFEQFSIKRPFPSFFRVHWRVLNVDGFHYTLRFEPVKYTWSLHAKRTEERFPADFNAGEISGE
jgi:hypothetical protein